MSAPWGEWMGRLRGDSTARGCLVRRHACVALRPLRGLRDRHERETAEPATTSWGRARSRSSSASWPAAASPSPSRRTYVEPRGRVCVASRYQSVSSGCVSPGQSSASGVTTRRPPGSRSPGRERSSRTSRGLRTQQGPDETVNVREPDGCRRFGRASERCLMPKGLSSRRYASPLVALPRNAVRLTGYVRIPTVGISRSSACPQRQSPPRRHPAPVRTTSSVARPGVRWSEPLLRPEGRRVT